MFSQVDAFGGRGHSKAWCGGVSAGPEEAVDARSIRLRYSYHLAGMPACAFLASLLPGFVKPSSGNSEASKTIARTIGWVGSSPGAPWQP